MTDFAITNSSSVWITRTLTLRCLMKSRERFPCYGFGRGRSRERRAPRKCAPGSQARSRQCHRRRPASPALQCGGERANAFPDLVTEDRDCLRGPDVMRLSLQQVMHIRAGLRDAQQAGMKIDHLIKLAGAHRFLACQVGDQSGVQITGTRAHRDAAGRGEAHACIHRPAIAHRGQTLPHSQDGRG